MTGKVDGPALLDEHCSKSFLLASVCNMDVSVLEKYGRVIFFQNSSFIS